LKILIATHNRWKYQLFAQIFAMHGFETIMLSDIEVGNDLPVENGDTVVKNARIKAQHYYSVKHPWVFGDDTGLEIEALNNEPGVQARRWNGRFPDDVDEQVWLNYLIERMKDVPPGERTAHFVDGWALLDPNGGAYTYEVRGTFEIALQPVRPISPGSPVMAVAVGIPEDPAQILAEAQARWDEWGILTKLTQEKESR